MNEKYFLLGQDIVYKLLISCFLFYTHTTHRRPQIFKDLKQTCLSSLWIGFSDQQTGRLKHSFFDWVPIFESIDKVFDSGFEFLSGSPQVIHPNSQHELEFGSFAEGSVVKIAVWENSVKTIGVSVAWLIQNDNIFHCVLILHHCLKDVGDLCFRLMSSPHYSRLKFLSAGNIDEFSIF